MRSITIASNVSGLESSRERFLAKHSTSPERTHPAVRAGFMEFLSVIYGLFADFDPPQTFADEKEMSGRWWWASVASKASACNAISRAHYLHLMQSCRVGLRDPYPHMDKPPTWHVTWRRVLVKSRVRSCVRGAERERSLEQETEATETKFGRERSRGSISDEYSSRKAC